MRYILATSFAIATLSALPAVAQSTPIELSAPTMSETDKAEPDWYRQFTLSSPSDEAPIWQTQPSKQVKLAFVKGDKWQLSVDLTSRPDDSPLAKEEMRAGAEFRITPRISVGGTLSVGSNDIDQTFQQFEGEEIEAGIRLRSAFKF
ncbi:MAG: NtrZ family periplasmic regulatory protein [Henriciella sp.]|uniref:NtrZ family periplasmic regulatory protein n=1 Tax=Henriciella sp. TaxID=1968823 RepID=UPI003C718622